MDAAAMTARMIGAIRNPRTNVLGHCTGRMVMGNRGTRPSSEFDAKAVFEACVEHDVAVEINSRPSAATRRPAARAGPRPRLPVLDRLRQPRAGPARLPRLRLRAGRGGRHRRRSDRQHLAARALLAWAEGRSRVERYRGVGRQCAMPDDPVEVRRSKRRRRTVSAYREGDRIVVLIPASLSRAQEAEWVETMVARLEKAEAGAGPATTT
jgi:hypothetical protein